jgi:hypothetical protein
MSHGVTLKTANIATAQQENLKIRITEMGHGTARNADSRSDVKKPGHLFKCAGRSPPRRMAGESLTLR